MLISIEERAVAMQCFVYSKGRCLLPWVCKSGESIWTNNELRLQIRSLA